jgi:hypothetical protein
MNTPIEPTEPPVLPAPNRLVSLVFAVALIVALVSVGIPLGIAHWRAALHAAPVAAARLAAPLAVPTPIRVGDPCPDPKAHYGMYDPVTGEARPGGYRVIPPGETGAR